MILPNLLIVGAAKSGTTSLHNYLSQHPDVFMSKHKEPHFLINNEIGLSRIPKGINKIVYNRDWESGMMSSIYAGMSKLEKDVDGNMIVLGDMPLINTMTINKIIGEFNKHDGNHIVYPIYGDRQANPVIFPRKYFPEILNSKGDKGCKKVLKKYPGDSVGIHINSDEVIIDCDTKDDYFLIEKKFINNVQT